jgi:hypothetical protein
MGKTFKDIRRHGREPRDTRASRSALRPATRCGLTMKVCFTSQEAALQRGGEILTSEKRAPENQALQFRAYRCHHCQQWHLTSK